MQGKLSLISLPKTLSLWYPDEHSLIFMRPSLENSSILVDVYLVVTFDLSIKAFCKNVIFPHSLSCLSDIRQLESLVNEISSAPYRCESSKNSESTASHISSANVHIQQAIDIIHTSSDVETSEHPEIQFIQCQLENSLVPKNRRRYYILTQISLKTHLISPACYKYLQHMPCLSLPHFNTLEKLYSPFGLENEFFPFLRQATCSFSNEQKHVILQMDEIHVKPGTVELD